MSATATKRTTLPPEQRVENDNDRHAELSRRVGERLLVRPSTWRRLLSRRSR
jgi:hypothetical protein